MRLVAHRVSADDAKISHPGAGRPCLCAIKIIPKEFYCQDCHFTWSNEEERTIGRLWHRFFPGRESPGELGRTRLRPFACLRDNWRG